ncbi:arylsulfatase [Echinicola marina]|uniref:arylsulfatase n=1 Tax=Echinicola marina TaxID=2859768 RepID=UPI001CF71691|nr:arylsulfatase [Echinicola marina]UCS94597.1 arylsulfatase [Echinicola marina]
MRNYLSYLLFGTVLLLFPNKLFSQSPGKPNVILIITDDQGYGDLGITGNPYVKTPNIDQLARESIRFNQFYVSPVCAPTRSSLMTGRYSLRTGIRDTYNGGAIMASEEITLAEMLKDAGYQTGAFGKWHLGDNHPSRPNDQGFDESLIHLSGGMGQVGDFTTYFKGDSSYFDPVLWHNGQKEAYEGYCSDIFAGEAIKFIEDNSHQPFFCYLAFNAPHTPLQVPEEYYEKYRDIDPSVGFDEEKKPYRDMSEKDKEDARKVYAMVNNIDDNLGRLFRKLKELGIEKNTILVFMTDNGPQQMRYLAGMRGKKGDVYRGGVRVPFYLKYPAAFDGDMDIETSAMHMDVLPTLADLCQADLPTDRVIDGKSLLPLMQGEKVAWEERPLFFYWTRRYPELYQNMALQQGDYRLVAHASYDSNWQDFELFDMGEDPYERHNINEENPAVAQNMKKQLEAIYKELIQSEHIKNQPFISVGNEQENPVVLNRNDAGGERGIWNQEEVYGKWRVKVEKGRYSIRYKFIKPIPAGGRMVLEAGAQVFQSKNSEETDMIVMDNVNLDKMEGDLIPFYAVKGKNIMPFWVEIEKLEY